MVLYKVVPRPKLTGVDLTRFIINFCAANYGRMETVMVILITGFEPFDGEQVNPSYQAIEQLPDYIGNHLIIKKKLPTTFRRSLVVLKQFIKNHQPTLVICVGQAGGRFAITPERVAINIDDAHIPDNIGAHPVDCPIYSDGPAAYFSSLPCKAIVENIKKAGIPATISDTAGTFVCNHVMYGLLHLIAEKSLPITAGFIHVPYVTEQILDKTAMPSLALTQIRDALYIAIETSLSCCVASSAND